MSGTGPDPLRELARSFGVQLDYVAMDGQDRPASSESLLGVLRALGVEIFDESEAPEALSERRLSLWRRRIEPVIVAWEGEPSSTEVRLPSSLASSRLKCGLIEESGQSHSWAASADEMAVEGSADFQFERFVSRRLRLPEGLSPGYHRLSVEFEDGKTAESLVISAPRRAYQGSTGSGKRPWGVFCPLHSLHGARSRGAGDLADLEALIDWTAGLGGGLVATLPMLASSFDGPSPVISPYSPTSRLFWNEFYLDLDRIPEMAHSEAARSLLQSDDFGREFEALRGEGLVDYGRQMRLKRAVLEQLAEDFQGIEGDRKAAFRAFIARHPEVEKYAFFQAAGERHGRDWRTWPASLNAAHAAQDGADIDPRAYRYHLYAQWQADEQLRDLAARARGKGLSWYLDFPVGVDFNSFDVWSQPEAFATGASVGCPPDPVFTKGQHWGFPPLHPDRQREQGYKYLIASFRNHFRHANALRIDHVMGLHRLFWIPTGAEAKDGAFVSTPSEEIYAILSIESHRQSAWLVGEDLGTVPPEVEGALKDHGIRGMYVVQYEIRTDADVPLREVPEATVAGVNTHDMPPFAAFWQGLDLDDRKDLGLLDAEALEQQRQVRADQRMAVVEFLRAEGMLAPDLDDTGSVLRATWDWLAASPAGFLLLNVEDLWLETEPQNTPNTYLERPNWRRKLRRAFEGFAENPDFLRTLKRIDKLRSEPARSHG
ncbi:4-alpha-glucanotransferase [Tundrisphaera lichenicola]|uniref:4-alpha-glucanotransferase n=1 Tax=Tundrisphaera lichenicola TaxID=2029860 RepID=UPI003EBDCCE0